jgi:transaldolase
MAIETAPSALSETVTATPTEIWNDSCAAAELEEAMRHGATGVTSNPVLVLDALRLEPEPWTGRIAELAAAAPAASDADLAWRIAEEVAVRGAALLEPVFRETHGRRGRISVQVDPARYAIATPRRCSSRRPASMGSPRTSR